MEYVFTRDISLLFSVNRSIPGFHFFNNKFKSTINNKRERYLACCNDPKREKNAPFRGLKITSIAMPNVYARDPRLRDIPGNLRFIKLLYAMHKMRVSASCPVQFNE
jgi:hypothetical protein